MAGKKREGKGRKREGKKKMACESDPVILSKWRRLGGTKGERKKRGGKNDGLRE